METKIFPLNIISPVYFIPVEAPEPFMEPAAGAQVKGGRIFCFELDENERLAFEPAQNKLLGKLVSGGNAAGEGMAAEAQIPAGNYLFAQSRELLNKKEIIALAGEIQKEGLWQRLKPGKDLYLRYLFEDGSWVTQLFREYS